MDEKKSKPLVLPTVPLSRQLKVILITVLLIGGSGFAFGAISLGLYLGQSPPTPNNTTNNYYNYTYPVWNYNYTQYTSYYNTTYIFNNATGQRSLYNCCLFNLIGLPQNTVSYFFNLTLKSKTVIELFMIKNNAGEDLNNVAVRYNLSIDGNSAPSVGTFLEKSIMGRSWYLEPTTDVGGTKIILPHTLPNGSTYICQFRIQHTDTSLGNFQILLGYSIYF